MSTTRSIIIGVDWAKGPDTTVASMVDANGRVLGSRHVVACGRNFGKTAAMAKANGRRLRLGPRPAQLAVSQLQARVNGLQAKVKPQPHKPRACRLSEPKRPAEPDSRD